MRETFPAPAPRALVVGALLCWLLTAAAAVWEVLAAQAPGSPYRAGVLPGPVEQLRGTSFMLGVGLLFGSWLWPQAFSPGRGRYWPWLALSGAALLLSALACAAWFGMYGVQIDDPRPGSSWLIAARAAGHALCTAALLDLLVRYLRGGS